VRRCRPGRLFAFNDRVIVLAGGVYWREPGLFGVGDSDEAKRRVRRGRLHLALEGEEGSSDDIRLGGVELVREAFEALTLVTDEVYLEWGCFADTLSCHETPS